MVNPFWEFSTWKTLRKFAINQNGLDGTIIIQYYYNSWQHKQKYEGITRFSINNTSITPWDLNHQNRICFSSEGTSFKTEIFSFKMSSPMFLTVWRKLHELKEWHSSRFYVALIEKWEHFRLCDPKLPLHTCLTPKFWWSSCMAGDWTRWPLWSLPTLCDSMILRS